MSTKDDYNPIFEIDEMTEIRQIWFAGSNQRDILGMLYKDKDGWVLKYRFRHYAMPVSNYWDSQETVRESAFDDQDTKRVFSMRPKGSQAPTEAELEHIAHGFTRSMEELVKQMQKVYDPEAFMWTRRVSSAKEVMDILTKAPWAHVKRVEKDD